MTRAKQGLSPSYPRQLLSVVAPRRVETLVHILHRPPQFLGEGEGEDVGILGDACSIGRVCRETQQILSDFCHTLCDFLVCYTQESHNAPTN